MGDGMKIRICATGDLMLLDRFPADYNYETVANEIKKNDVKITNLESVVSNWDCFASTFCGGQWINTEPDKLDEIAKYGFNLYSCANNHSMDYSFDGILSTKRELNKRGMCFAGIGESLDESSAAVYYSIPDKNIKVAFISVTATFIDAARAGNSKDKIPSRPGVNPLRISTRYEVSKEHYEQLKEIARVTHINGERDNARKIGSLPPEEAGSINFGGHFFVVAEDQERKFTYCQKGDLKRITDEIVLAKKKADYVIVSVHSHQIKRDSYTEPDYFLEEFAHKCIDCGACAVVGSGTHQLKPIELYKGKPIFYSLGNFIFQSGMVKMLPADFWDKYHYPSELNVKEGLARKTKNGTIGLETDKNNFLSIIPMMEFINGELTKLDLIPIELAFEKERRLKGLPVLADLKNTEYIYEYMRTISANYGTVLEKKDKIKVNLKSSIRERGSE